MSKHTAIVAVTYKILGEAKEYTGTFSVTVDEDTSMGEIEQALSNGVAQLEPTTKEFGWGLLTHLSRMTALAQTEAESDNDD